MKFLHFIIAILFLGLLSGCSVDTILSDKVDENELYGHYRVSYSKKSNDLFLSAGLRVGGVTGTTVKLVAPSLLKVEEGDLTEKNFLGTDYSLRISLTQEQSTKSEYKFTWVKKDGTEVVNVVPTARSVSLKDDMSGKSMSKASSLNIDFAGEALSDDEEIRIAIHSQVRPDYTKSEVSTVSKTVRALAVSFTVEELKNLVKGKAEIRLERIRTQMSASGHEKVGGMRSSIYEATTVEVTVVE
jgi:hypothetical protein